MKKIIDSIEKIHEYIFAYDVKSAVNGIAALIEWVSGLMQGLDINQINNLNQMLKYLGIAVENQDYLLASDILRYELEPALQRLMITTGGCN